MWVQEGYAWQVCVSRSPCCLNSGREHQAVSMSMVADTASRGPTDNVGSRRDEEGYSWKPERYAIGDDE